MPRPKPSRPAPRLPGTRVGRLPSAADTAAGPAPDAEAPRPPIEAFAQPADLAPGRPRLAIILIDEGAAADTVLPFPVTYAVDASLPDAATGRVSCAPPATRSR